MKTIAIIIPYFGTWPQWIDLFFASCRQNSTIDFYFFTDNEVPETNRMSNIHLQKICFKDYCDMVSDKLNTDFHPDKAYKLCDLRPFYGYIHQDILTNYDFWGYGDVDLVWGNLRNFYTDYILNNYDVFSAHADRLSGHLTIIRNSPKYNNLAFCIPQWKYLIADSRNHAVDEQHFTLQLYPQAKWMWKIHKYVFFRFNFKDEWEAYNRFCRFFNAVFKPHKLYFKEHYTTPWFTVEEAKDSSIINNRKWLYERGKVSDCQNNRELPYLHFLSLKQYWKGCFFSKVDTSRPVSISLLGIQV